MSSGVKFFGVLASRASRTARCKWMKLHRPGQSQLSFLTKEFQRIVIRQDVAWDHLAVLLSALKVIREADAICFGSLAQRSEISRVSIQRLVAAAPATALRVFDINLRQNYFSGAVIEQSLRLANVLKLNEDELPILADLFNLAGSTRHQIERLAHQFSLHLIALTRGPAGSLLFKAGQWADCPSVPIKIVDTVGAGDSFTAALVLGLLQKKELNEVNALADEVARYVCSCTGATPPLPRSICVRFDTSHVTGKIAPELTGVPELNLI